MKPAKDLLVIIGLGFVLAVAIGVFVPGISFRACLGPTETCKLVSEEQP